MCKEILFMLARCDCIVETEAKQGLWRRSLSFEEVGAKVGEGAEAALMAAGQSQWRHRSVQS